MKSRPEPKAEPSCDCAKQTRRQYGYALRKRRQETSTDVVNDEVYIAFCAADLRVQRTGPDLGVGTERVGSAANVEVEWLKSLEL
jgi:hypothetical protein